MINLPIKPYPKLPIKSYVRLPIIRGGIICVIAPDSYTVENNQYVISYIDLPNIPVSEETLGYLGNTTKTGCFNYDFSGFLPNQVTLTTQQVENYVNFWGNFDKNQPIEIELARKLKIYTRDSETHDIIEGVELSHYCEWWETGCYWAGTTNAEGYAEVDNNDNDLPFTTPLTWIKIRVSKTHYQDDIISIHLNKAMSVIDLYLYDYPFTEYNLGDSLTENMIEGAGGDTAKVIGFFIEVRDTSGQPTSFLNTYGVLLRDIDKHFGADEFGDPLLGFGNYAFPLPEDINDIDSEYWTPSDTLIPIPYDTGTSEDFKSMDIEITGESDSDPDTEDGGSFEIKYKNILNQGGAYITNRIQFDNYGGFVEFNFTFKLYIKQ